MTRRCKWAIVLLFLAIALLGMGLKVPMAVVCLVGAWLMTEELK